MPPYTDPESEEDRAPEEMFKRLKARNLSPEVEYEAALKGE